MAGVVAALEAVTESLLAAGVPAAVDPRDVNLPGAWVQHVSHFDDVLAPGCVSARLRVLLIAPDVGAWQALQILEDLEELALMVISLNADTPVTDRVVQLPDSGTYYPARVLETDVQISPDPDPDPPF